MSFPKKKTTVQGSKKNVRKMLDNWIINWQLDEDQNKMLDKFFKEDPKDNPINKINKFNK